MMTRLFSGSTFSTTPLTANSRMPTGAAAPASAAGERTANATITLVTNKDTAPPRILQRLIAPRPGVQPFPKARVRKTDIMSRYDASARKLVPDKRHRSSTISIWRASEKKFSEEESFFQEPIAF
jgi:hypothetical protein